MKAEGLLIFTIKAHRSSAIDRTCPNYHSRHYLRHRSFRSIRFVDSPPALPCEDELEQPPRALTATQPLPVPHEPRAAM